MNASRASRAAEPALTEATDATEASEPGSEASEARPLPTTPPITPQPALDGGVELPGETWSEAPHMPMGDVAPIPTPPPLPASVAPQPVAAAEPEYATVPAQAPEIQLPEMHPVAPAQMPGHPQPVSPHAESAPVAVPPISALRGLSEIMAGMQMPCDLAPLMGEAGATSIGLRRATFATTTYRPHEVGGALATELERLGMTIQSVSENQAVATRDADSVMLTIHRTAEMFPTAPEMAVVVEMDVV